MKKILGLLVLLSVPTHAFVEVSDYDFLAGEFLAKRGIIEASYSDLDYKLGDTISRREMLKVTINLSGTAAPDTCIGSFLDLPSSDWGCKYAEEALLRGYISSATYFRPDDNLTKIEALKLIMKAKNIQKTNHSDWRVGYTQGAFDAGITDGVFTDYNTSAVRGWIFQIAKNSINDALLDVEIYEKKVLGPPPATGYSLEQRLVMQAAIVRDIGNNFEIRQTHDYTYLYHNGDEVKSWYHLDMSSNFTWRSDMVNDLNCGQTIIAGASSLSGEQYGIIWDSLPENQRVNCVRQQFYFSLITQLHSNSDLIIIVLSNGSKGDYLLFDPVSEISYEIPFIQEYMNAKIERNIDGIYIKYMGINMPPGLLYINNQKETREIFFPIVRGPNVMKGGLVDYTLLSNGEIKLFLTDGWVNLLPVTREEIITKDNVPQ